MPERYAAPPGRAVDGDFFDEEEEMLHVGASGGRSPRGSTVDEMAVDYSRHPSLLWFRDAAVEQRYSDFIYIETQFRGGKLYGIVALIVFVGTYFVFPKGGPGLRVFADIWWIPMHISVVANVVILACMFVERLHKHRELAFIVLLATHWPAFTTVVMFGKEPHSHSYAYITCCYFFCCFVTQCRIARVAPLLCFSPIATLLLTTFALSDYYDTHSHFEILWWVLVVFPCGLVVMFERRTRASFVEMELAHAAADASERKTLVTRNMIASFFSATATRDLLLKHGPRSKLYPKTVLVVTNIVGFAAYLHRSQSADVIDTLTDFFLSIDSIASEHGVEKIATVGDVYFGAVFAAVEEPGRMSLSVSVHQLDRDDDNVDEDDAPDPSFITRCSNAVIFSCNVLGFARGLQVRSGVHVGDVTGGFVGCKPPKFDLFGPAVDHVKTLEATSRSGAAHVSHEVIKPCAGSAGPLGVHSATEHGVLCHAWNHQNPVDAIMLAADSTVCPAGASPSDIVAVLCDIAEDDEFTARASVGDESAGAPPGTAVTPERDSRSRSTADDDAMVDLHFHPLLLSFERPSVEARFCRSIHRSKITAVACKFWIVMELTLLLAHLNMGCFASQADRRATSAIAGIIAVMVAYVSYIGTAHRFNTPIVTTGFYAIFVVAALFIRSDCKDGYAMQEFYTDNVIMLYWTISVCVPQFCLDVKLAIRLFLLVTLGVGGALLLVLRRYVTHPATVAWDVAVIPIVTLSFTAMSYYADYSLRRAFVAVVRLKRLQVASSGRQAAMSGKAMGIMLPQFVIDRIVRAATVVADDDERPQTGPVDSSDTSAVGSGAVGLRVQSQVTIDFANAHPVWDFPSVGVMMIHFTVAHSLDSFTTIRRVINHVEAVIGNHGVFKLKTVGTTMMCLLGIDDSLAPESCALKLVIAARAVRAQVLKPLTDSLHDDASFQISIHGGPCFGAVIGDESFIFDVFGETINDAVALVKHAPARGIQLTHAMQLLISPEVGNQHRFTVAPAPPVALPKRQSHIQVFDVGAAPTAASVLGP
jgi:class 3 adenylate cyclase